MEGTDGALYGRFMPIHNRQERSIEDAHVSPGSSFAAVHRRQLHAAEPMMTILVISLIVVGFFALRWREKLKDIEWTIQQDRLRWWRQHRAEQLLTEGELTVARWDALVEQHGYDEANLILAEIRRISPDHR